MTAATPGAKALATPQRDSIRKNKGKAAIVAAEDPASNWTGHPKSTQAKSAARYRLLAN